MYVSGYVRTASRPKSCSKKYSTYPSLLPSIHSARFNSPLGFEPTPEVAIFDLLGITLVHGWLVDPEDIETAEALGTRSYNQVNACKETVEALCIPVMG